MDSYTKHEAMDRAFLAVDYVENTLVHHEYYTSGENEEFNKLVDEAVKCLSEAYQVINRTDMEAMKKSFLDCMSELAGMLPKVEVEVEDEDVMDKCGKCGSGITLLDKAVSRERGIGLCSPCLHQDNLRREKDEDAQMIKPKHPSPIKNKDLTVKTDDKGVITGIVHHKENVSKPDMVNKPPHYRDASGIECIEVTRYMQFCGGNCFKYLYRAGQKGDAVEDLKKAAWYAERAWVNDGSKQPNSLQWCQDIRSIASHRTTNIKKAMNSIRRYDWSLVKESIETEIARLESE